MRIYQSMYIKFGGNVLFRNEMTLNDISIPPDRIAKITSHKIKYNI